MTALDTVRKLIDEARGTSISPEIATRPQRGHAPKIAAAVDVLRAEGKLPQYLRPCLRDRRIQDELVRQG